MKLFVSALAAAVAFHQSVLAWDITSTDAVAPTTPASEHETLTKTWTVAGADVLSQLNINTLGRVFVDYDSSLVANATDASRVVAKVVLSGNSSTLLDAFEVFNVDDAPQAVGLRLKNEDLDDKAFLLTQIYIGDKQLVDTINHVWEADVVVGDDVVVQNNATANVTLSLAGSGDLFVGSPSAEFSLSNVAVSVAGSGDVQVLAKSFAANQSLVVAVAGSGDVGVVADAITVVDNLVAAVAGSGDVFVQTDSLTTYNLTAAIAGSGSFTVSKDGTCQEQQIALAGSGDVATASIKSVNTQVNIIGSGDVIVQTSGNLTVSTLFGSGDVRYFGEKPAVIDEKSSLNFRGHKKHTVKHAKKNHFEEYEVQPTPERAPLFIVIQASKSIFSSSPNVHLLFESTTDEIFDFGGLFVGQQSLAARTFTRQNSFGIFVLAGAVFAVAGVAARQYKRREERARYAPLI